MSKEYNKQVGAYHPNDVEPENTIATKTITLLKVRVTGTYVSSRSYNERFDFIVNMPIDFTDTGIGNEIRKRYHPDRDSFTKNTIEVLCQISKDLELCNPKS